MNPFTRIYSPQYMVKEQDRVGTLPTLREAYGTNFRISWPSALEALLVALISLIDTMMVSRLGESAISAVGITTQPKFLLMAPIIALNVGITAVVARRKGEGDYEGARSTMKQCVIVSAILSACMTTAALIFAEPLMTLAGANDDYFAQATVYYRIVMVGQFFGCVGMSINAAQRGFGNTRISMLSNTVANLVNVLFNYLLINGIWFFPRLGVTGAAIATAIAGFICFCMSLCSVLRPNTGEKDAVMSILCKSSWRFQQRTLSSVSRVSSSALLEQLFMRFGFFTYAMMVARLGTNEYATHTVCISIIHIAFAFADGFGIGASALVGQSLGAGRPDLASIYGKVGQRFAMTIGLCLSVLFVCFRAQIMAAFSDTPEVISLGSQVIVVLAIICLAQTSQVVLNGCLRGAGDSRFVALISFVSVGVVRPLFSYLLCYPLGLGLVGAWLGMLVDQTLRLVWSMIRFRSNKWARIKL